MDFADMRLWELYDNMDFFVVQIPLEEPVVASIMGAGGQEYGLSVFRGPNAFRQPLMLYDKPKSAVDKIDTIGFSMMYYRDMDHLEKKWLKSCNYNARKSEWMPSVISKKPGRMMEMVEKDHDVKLMLYILKGIMQAQEDGDFRPTTAGAVDSKIMTIDVSGDVLEPDVSVKRRSFPGSKELLDLCNQDMPPKLSNTDGEPLEFITADFEYDDLGKVRKALKQRNDMDHDKDRDEYIWFKGNPDDSPMERTLLARILIEDNGIKAEVNSAGRLDRLTDMLQAIDGVHYINHDSRDVQDMLEEAPETEDAVEETVPEEVLAAARDQIREYYMDWLDLPIPILDNKTPRQFARSKKGAQKIKMLIETIPAPTGNTDVEIPRKEMLKEIGLGEKL